MSFEFWIEFVAESNFLHLLLYCQVQKKSNIEWDAPNQTFLCQKPPSYWCNHKMVVGCCGRGRRKQGHYNPHLIGLGVIVVCTYSKSRFVRFTVGWESQVYRYTEILLYILYSRILVSRQKLLLNKDFKDCVLRFHRTENPVDVHLLYLCACWITPWSGKLVYYIMVTETITMSHNEIRQTRWLINKPSSVALA